MRGNIDYEINVLYTSYTYSRPSIARANRGKNFRAMLQEAFSTEFCIQ